MTRLIHDQFAKDYLKDLLSAFGKVDTSYEVASEVRQIDVLFTPQQEQNSNVESLGLLGTIAKKPCIIEPFRNPPTVGEIRACINKLLDVYAYLTREGKKNKNRVNEDDLPSLWILVPTTSDEILSQLNIPGVITENKQSSKLQKPQSSSIPGIYISPDIIKTRIIVIHRLEVNPDTLWLRLLGKGGVQRKAIEEFNKLPLKHPSREKAALWLSNLQYRLQKQEKLKSEDQELVMALSPGFVKELQEAKQEGRQEGRQEANISLVLRLLSKRFGNLTPQLQEDINQLSLNRLENLSEALLDFSSIQDFQTWLSNSEDF